MKKEWQKIVISDLSGGLHNQYHQDIQTETKLMRENEYGRGNFDPITIPGLMRPLTIKRTDLVNKTVVDASIRKFVPYSSTKLYAIETGANIHEITYSNNTITSPQFAEITAVGTHAAHTGFTCDDMVVYQKNGTICFLASWNDNVDGDVALIEADGTLDADYFSATATGGQVLGKYYHPLLVAPNQFCYTGDANSIHKLDGTTAGGANGTASLSAIDAPKGWVFKDFEHWGGYMMAAANNLPGGGDLGFIDVEKAVYIWDYSSVSGGDLDGFESVIPVRGQGNLDYIFIHENIPHIFVSNSTYSEIQKFDGMNFVPIKRINAEDRPYSKGSFTDYKGLTMWTSVSTGLMLYGRIFPNSMPGIYRFGSSVDGGAIHTALITDRYFGGAGNDNAYRIDVPGSNTDVITDCLHGTYDIFFTKVYDLPAQSQIHGVNLYWKPTSGETNVNVINELGFFLNMPSSATKDVSINVKINQGKGFLFVPYHKTNVNTVQLTWDYSSISTRAKAIIPHRIEILWSPKQKII